MNLSDAAYIFTRLYNLRVICRQTIRGPLALIVFLEIIKPIILKRNIIQRIVHKNFNVWLYIPFNIQFEIHLILMGHEEVQ